MSSGGGQRSAKSVQIEGMIAGIEHRNFGDPHQRDMEAALATKGTRTRMRKELMIIGSLLLGATLLSLWLILTWNP